jgi:ATP-dependent Lon protease
MLRKNVVDAVKKGKFHIYSVKTIDEGIEILTGKTAGALQADGAYPEGSINYLVDEKLKSLAEGLKKFVGEEEEALAPEAKGKGKGRKGKK